MRLQESVLLVFLAALMVEAGPLPSNKILSKREDGQPQTNQPTTGPIAVTGVSAACVSIHPLTLHLHSIYITLLTNTLPFTDHLHDDANEIPRTGSGNLMAISVARK